MGAASLLFVASLLVPGADASGYRTRDMNFVHAVPLTSDPSGVEQVTLGLANDGDNTGMTVTWTTPLGSAVPDSIVQFDVSTTYAVWTPCRTASTARSYMPRS